jgi:hypothetical protein
VTAAIPSTTLLLNAGRSAGVRLLTSPASMTISSPNQTVGEFLGRKVIGGQRWRYEFEQRGAETLVHHSYVWGYATLPRLTIQLPVSPRGGEWPWRTLLPTSSARLPACRCRVLS